MSRFYVGQPVVCVWGYDDWQTNGRHGRNAPVRGRRYVVNYTGTGYSCLNEAHPCVGLEGMPSEHAYRETGFAPITEEQVRGIIEEAQRQPSDAVRRREVEDA